MRGVSFCAEGGKLGVISSNSFLRGKQLERLRSDLLQDRLTAVCDLGLNVMDDAWVESAAYILSEGMAGDIVFIDVRDALDKSDAILVSFSQDRSTECFYVHPRNAFSSVPRNAFLYD